MPGTLEPRGTEVPARRQRISVPNNNLACVGHFTAVPKIGLRPACGTGIAIEDAAVAVLVYEKAVQAKSGVEFRF